MKAKQSHVWTNSRENFWTIRIECSTCGRVEDYDPDAGYVNKRGKVKSFKSPWFLRVKGNTKLCAKKRGEFPIGEDGYVIPEDLEVKARKQ